MQSRRGFLMKVAAGFGAMGLVVVGTVLADELLGTITKVDVEGKKLTVVGEEDEKKVEIKVNDDTEVVFKGQTKKLDLEKLHDRVKKFQDEGKKGVRVKITHENGVASKIEYQRKKKAE
jgi:LytS/YehU family sensor histidine kinase